MPLVTPSICLFQYITMVKKKNLTCSISAGLFLVSRCSLIGQQFFCKFISCFFNILEFVLNTYYLRTAPLTCPCLSLKLPFNKFECLSFIANLYEHY